MKIIDASLSFIFWDYRFKTFYCSICKTLVGYKSLKRHINQKHNNLKFPSINLSLIYNELINNQPDHIEIIDIKKSSFDNRIDGFDLIDGFYCSFEDWIYWN